MKTRKALDPLSRRKFLGHAALATAAFQFVPGHVLGLRGQTPPTGKLNIAGIGVGGQGAGDISQMAGENIVALCDVDWAHAAGTLKKFPQARQFKDFRKMFDEQKNIDAVVVATPDHVHAIASLTAIKLGKHVYCEKPLTHSVYEARQVAEAACAHKVATQMGNQGQASEDTRKLCEAVWGGAIGAVREAHIWTDRPSNGLFNEYWPQGVERPKDTPAVPATLDWDAWLGPAPERPYHPAYLPFKWRGWWDFGTGALGDIGCHAMDPVFRALKLGSSVVWPEKPTWAPGGAAPATPVHPISVQASSTRVNKETFPLASMVTYQFAARGDMPALKVIWYDGGLRPPRPEGLREGVEMGANGRLLVGDKGFILGTRIYPESRRAEVGEVPKTIARSDGHYKEWIEACKGGKPGGSNFDWAGPLAEIVLLGNVALRLQLREALTRASLLWDPANLKITNLPEANEFLRREYRQGWVV
ncbi:MAG: Gfo/Idh/MocA family oxidoreductase [Verrucomicrobia bacterium]|nr:Gfo/Idh/MocA family oxidoreductase [Verrucomicrobiota bacterium]